MWGKRVNRYKSLLFHLILTCVTLKESVRADNEVCFLPMTQEDIHPICPLNPLEDQHLRVIAAEVFYENINIFLLKKWANITVCIFYSR